MMVLNVATIFLVILSLLKEKKEVLLPHISYTKEGEENWIVGVMSGGYDVQNDMSCRLIWAEHLVLRDAVANKRGEIA